MQEIFRTEPAIRAYLLFLAALLGAVMGSFLLCMADRIVHQRPLGGRSVCDGCGRTLGVRDLIPIFSYLFSRGKCRVCGKKLSPLYLVSELLGAVSFFIVVLLYGMSLQTLLQLIFVSLLMAISFADLEECIIPDRFIVIGLAVRLLYLVFLERESLIPCLIGAVAVPLVLLLIVLVCEKLLKREAMGGGDIKLMAMCGLFLGWQRCILCLLCACVIGILFGFISLRREENEGGAFPWGPSIALAAFLSLLFGDGLISAYLGLFH